MSNMQQVKDALPHLTMREQLSVLSDILGGATVRQSDEFSDALFDVSGLFDMQYARIERAAEESSQ